MLRNKYVVTALGAVLLLVVAYNIQFFRTRAVNQAAGTAAQTYSSAIQHPRTSSPPPRVMMPSLPVEEWRRDPFWYPLSTKHALPVQHTGSSRPSSGMRLEATMVKDGKGFAVISGQVVGLGERVGEYVVVEVGDLFVRLKGPGGVKKMSITTDTSVKE
jgi:type II secretory pathway pseudopilin PulG